MRSHPTRKTLQWTLATAVVVVATGCGGDDDASSSDAAESAYCDTTREWAIHELVAFDDSDPAAFKAYWTEFQAFEQAAMEQAPAELQKDWVLKVETEDETINPVLEKYDYDIAAIMESATPEEQATFEAPPEVQVAQDRILAYESEVCGAWFPLAADVSFAGEVAGSYCDLVAADNERIAEVMAGGAEPSAVEALAASFGASDPAMVEAAPEVIKDDVAAVGNWTAGPQRAVLERYGWDIGAVIRGGSVQDRADLNYIDEDIREQYARVRAYEEQVCGA